MSRQTTGPEAEPGPFDPPFLLRVLVLTGSSRVVFSSTSREKKSLIAGHNNQLTQIPARAAGRGPARSDINKRPRPRSSPSDRLGVRLRPEPCVNMMTASLISDAQCTGTRHVTAGCDRDSTDPRATDPHTHWHWQADARQLAGSLRLSRLADQARTRLGWDAFSGWQAAGRAPQSRRSESGLHSSR